MNYHGNIEDPPEGAEGGDSMTIRDERILALADSHYIRHLVDGAPKPTDHPKDQP